MQFSIRSQSKSIPKPGRSGSIATPSWTTMGSVNPKSNRHSGVRSSIKLLLGIAAAHWRLGNSNGCIIAVQPSGPEITNHSSMIDDKADWDFDRSDGQAITTVSLPNNSTWQKPNRQCQRPRISARRSRVALLRAALRHSIVHKVQTRESQPFPTREPTSVSHVVRPRGRNVALDG